LKILLCLRFPSSGVSVYSVFDCILRVSTFGFFLLVPPFYPLKPGRFNFNPLMASSSPPLLSPKIVFEAEPPVSATKFTQASESLLQPLFSDPSTLKKKSRQRPPPFFFESPLVLMF